MRIPWQSFSRKKNSPATTLATKKKLKKKFLPTMELLEKRDMMNAAVITVNNNLDQVGNTGLPALMTVSGGVDYYCGTLREAINLANQNGFTAYTINLASGGTYTATLPGNSNVSDLNSGGAFDIRSAEPVTIETASGGAAATIVGLSSGGTDRVFDIGPKSNVTFIDVEITGGSTSTAGGGIRSAPGSIVLLNNSTVTGNTAADGGGVAAGFTGFNLSGGTLTFPSGTLSLGPLSGGSGGCLSVSGGSSVTDNAATGDGYAEGGGIASCGESLLITSSTVSGNTAGVDKVVAGEGGGVYVVDPAPHFTSGTNVTFTNATISGNVAEGFSGGSGGLGGGLYLSRTDTASISGGCISGNEANSGSYSGGQGGGVFLTSIHAASGGAGGTVIFSNTSISCNTAAGGFSGGTGGYGGGAFINTAEKVTFTAATFDGNQAWAANTASGYGGKGGGIYATGAIVTLTTSTIGGSTSGGNNNVGHGQATGGSGGGIYFTDLGEKVSGGSSTLTICSSTIQHNIAEGGGFSGGATPGGEGAGLYLAAYGAYSGGTQVSITSSNFLSNRALGGFSGGTGGEGGGMYIGCNVAVCISGGSISGNTAGGATTAGGEAKSGHGGGIYATGAILHLTNVTIGGTSAGAGNLAAQGFSGGTWDGGQGGGIYFIDLGKVLEGTGSASVTSSLTISGGCITNNDAQTGFSGGTAAQGGGIFALAAPGCYLGGTQISITNATISDNEAGSDNGGIGGYGNPAPPGGEGGGMYLGCNLAVCISGGSISGNTALAASGGGGTGKGGGIFANGDILKLTNVTVNCNTAQGFSGGGSGFSGGSGASGGGIFFENLGEKLSGSTPAIAPALVGTGSILSSLTISGGSVSFNLAGGGAHEGGEGGGIFASSFGCYSGGTQVTISCATISGNTAQGAISGGGGGAGGGIFIGCNLAVCITNTTISCNTAGGATSFSGGYHYSEGGQGGGIYATGAIVTLTNSSVIGNLAQAGVNGFSGGSGYGGAGGGIFFRDLGKVLGSVSGTVIQSTLTISGGCVSNNLAQGGNAVSDTPFSGGGFAVGGGIFASAYGSYSGGTQITINCATIKGNTAEGGTSGGLGGAGGGMFLERNLSVKITGSTISSNTAGGSTGFHLPSGGGLSGGGLSGGGLSGGGLSGGGLSGGSVIRYSDTGVKISSSIVEGSSYSPGNGGVGGGIFTSGDIVVLTNTTIGGPSACNGNVAQGGFSGGFGGQGGGIFATDLGKVISSSSASVVQSSLTISGGCITNNVACGSDWSPASGGQYFLPAGAGGGIYAQSFSGGYYNGGTQLTITCVTISCNTAHGGAGGAGGGIFLFDGLSVCITGSTISGNTATGACGGSSDPYDSNYNGGGEGGGIFTQGDILKLTSDTIGGPSACNGNVAGAGFEGAGGLGGGILAADLGGFLYGSTATASLTLSGGCVTNNVAQGAEFGGRGGGILATDFSGGSSLVGSPVTKPATFEGGYSGGTQVSITCTTISKNAACGGFFSGGTGGGLLLAGPIQACITSSTITCNTASGAFGSYGQEGGGAGGGIASYFAILKLTSTSVTGNVATGDCASGGESGAGGGILAASLGEFISAESYTVTQSSLSISGGCVSGNAALGGGEDGGVGGGILASGTLSGGGTQVCITNATISGNCTTGGYSGGSYNGGSGGGIFLVEVKAVISGTTSGGTCISDNTAGSTGAAGVGAGHGGGIFMYDAILQLTNVNVTGNTAAGNFHNVSGGGGSGGGIFAEGLGESVGFLVVPATPVSGGAMTSLSITTSTITCNSATNGCEGGGEGGGIAATGSGGGCLGFFMIDSTVSYNYVGACSGGSSLCEEGAGIAFVDVNASIFACLIDYNKTDGSANSAGGGVYVGYCSTVSITNTTIAFNSAGCGAGGGVFTTCLDTVCLVNDTIAYNIAAVGGGVYRLGASGGAQTSVLNTIIAKNMSKASGGTETDVFGYFNDEGYNLIGTNVGVEGTAFAEASYAGANTAHIVVNANHDWVGGAIHGALTTAQVGLATALAINQLPSPFGVPYTFTLALQAGSLAIGGGLDNATTQADLTAPGGLYPQDQRGPTYIRLGEFDIGAYQKTPVNTINTVGRGGDDT